MGRPRARAKGNLSMEATTGIIPFTPTVPVRNDDWSRSSAGPWGLGLAFQASSDKSWDRCFTSPQSLAARCDRPAYLFLFGFSSSHFLLTLEHRFLKLPDLLPQLRVLPAAVFGPRQNFVRRFKRLIKSFVFFFSHTPCVDSSLRDWRATGNRKLVSAVRTRCLQPVEALRKKPKERQDTA
jgi:hypothetical protein